MKEITVRCLSKIFMLVMLLFITGISQSGWDAPHPILDYEDGKYRAPLDLASVSLEKLIEHQNFYRSELSRLRSIVAQKTDQELLLKALLAYDLKRVKLAEVIPELIKVYQIKDKLRQQMLTYAETIREIYQNHGVHIQSLQEYKPYDFRLGMAYSSMMVVIMSEDSQLYRRMQTDMKVPGTVIGRYITELDLAYKGVERVNIEIKEFHLLGQVEKELGRVNDELSRR